MNELVTLLHCRVLCHLIGVPVRVDDNALSQHMNLERRVQSLELEKKLVEDRADELASQIDRMKSELGQHEVGLATLHQQVKETEQLLNEARTSLGLNETEIDELIDQLTNPFRRLRLIARQRGPSKLLNSKKPGLEKVRRNRGLSRVSNMSYKLRYTGTISPRSMSKQGRLEFYPCLVKRRAVTGI
ncbi:hypothetical protein ACFE04_022930 [Oxalis oulophora]